MNAKEATNFIIISKNQISVCGAVCMCFVGRGLAPAACTITLDSLGYFGDNHCSNDALRILII
jgi:hypothetical protein